MSTEDIIYEEDLRKEFYTKAKVFWSRRKVWKISESNDYVYQSMLRVTEDEIEVYDFDGGLSLCSFALPKYVSGDEQLTMHIGWLFLDINQLEFYKDQMRSILVNKKDRKRYKKDFLRRLDKILSELMDLFNWYIDI